MFNSLCNARAALVVLLAISLAGCQSPPTDAEQSSDPKAEKPMTDALDALPDGTEWVLVSATAAGLDRPEAQAIKLSVAPTRLSGTGGCNRFSSGYQIVDKKLVIGAAAATKMGCPGAVGEIEQLLFALLPQLSSAKMDGIHLVLQNDAGASLRFSPATPAGE